MDFLDRIKINRYIKFKNYKNLVAVLNKMDEKDIEVIFQGLNRESVNDLLLYLYQFYMGRERFIILLAINSGYVKIQDVVSYFNFKGYHRDLLKKLVFLRLEEFIELIKKNYVNYEMIDFVVDFCIRNKNDKELEELRDYFLKVRLNASLAKIMAVQGFDCEEFRKILINEGNLKGIINYLNRVNDARVFIREFVNSYPKIGDIQEIALEFLEDKFDSKKEIYNILVEEVLNLEGNLELKSEYLFSLFQLKEDNRYRVVIIEELINLKVLGVINRLMRFLDDKEVEEIGDRYLNTCDYEKITILAVTTMGVITYKLIDKIVLESNDNYIRFLMGNLDDIYLDYALNKLLEIKGVSYFKVLINELYLDGYSNILKVINFIFKYRLENLFDRTVIDNLVLFKEKKLTLIRK